MGELVNLSLRRLKSILLENPAPFEDDYAKLVALQKDAAISVLNLAAKVDEGRLRARNESAIVTILEEVRRLKQPAPIPMLEVVDQGQDATC